MTRINEYTEHLADSIRIKTYWPSAAKTDEEEKRKALGLLTDFQNFLEKTYPAFHKTAERYVLSPFSVLYRWPGAAAANPPSAVLFAAHYDVVPAEAGKWSADPFAAEIINESDGTYLYGRGAQDMKCITLALFETAEELCNAAFVPKRDIWFALGGDEERSGTRGAAKAAQWFTQKNIRFDFVIDEGTPVAINQIKGVDRPLALVGIEEKGFLSVRLSVEQKPGHASQPPAVQAAAVLGHALVRIAKKPFPFRLGFAARAFFTALAPLAKAPLSFFMKHAAALGPLFFKAAAVSPAVTAMLRTTVAMTMLEGSPADNVMPSQVHAVMNLRLLPPWTIKTAIARLERIIADPRVKVSVYSAASEAVAATAEQAAGASPGWAEMAAAINAVFPDAPPLPFIMVATTDSRHYRLLTNAIYRFSPIEMDPVELGRIHGHDERISMTNLEHCLEFYRVLIKSL